MTKRLSAPLEKLELTIDNSDFITYFCRDFHCLDLRKMNKDCESAKETIIIKKRTPILHDSYLDFASLPRNFVDNGRLVKSAKESIAQI